MATGRQAAPASVSELQRLGFADDSGHLTERGDAFDRSWNIHRDRESAEDLLRQAYLALPETGALMQGIHGHPYLHVSGALHLLARHGLADPDDWTPFRAYLKALNDLGIVAYSVKQQSVRLVAPLPDSENHDDAPQPLVRIVEPDRRYSNVRHLREVLRGCRDFIWWADMHFEKRGLEPLADEADASRISVIRVLMVTRPKPNEVADYQRFTEEMAKLGITAEFRIVAAPERDWHDRFIIGRGEAWNVPPLNTIFKGDYSQFTRTPPPPFEAWWAKGAPLT